MSNTNANKAVPSVPYEEVGLLGTILMYPTGFVTAKECGVNADDFYNIQNRTIWNAMEQLNTKSEPVTSVSILTEL